MTGKFNINKTLYPLSWLYGGIVALRNKLFDRHILPSETFAVPVISIGNLTAGGTGKTPHTEYLIRLLSRKYRVAVLSRGYKRKSSGFIPAGDDASAEHIGDEPYQMFRKFPSALIAVDANRRRGIRKLLNLDSAQRPDVILLDDAFQHRYVTPSLSILLTDCSRLFCDDELLPAGRLRESQKNKSRAQIVIVTKCSPAMDAAGYREIAGKLQLLPGQELFFTSYKYKNLLPVFGESNPVKKESIDRLKKESYSVVLLAGLANPSGLINYLQTYISDLHPLIYPDHHVYNGNDLRRLSETFERIKNEKKIIVTSEKDAARLCDCPHVPETIRSALFYLPVEVAFNPDKEELFTQTIENHVRNFERNSFMA